MSHTRMIVPPFLVSKLCPFEFFSNILVCAITQLPLGICSCNFIEMSIRSGQCVVYNKDCFGLLSFRDMSL